MPHRQDSTNSYRLKKIKDVTSSGLSKPWASLYLGERLVSSGTSSFVWGYGAYNQNYINSFVSGTRNLSLGKFSGFPMVGIDVILDSHFTQSSIKNPLTDSSNNLLTSSDKDKNTFVNWFCEYLLIGTIPQEPSYIQSYFVTFGVLGLSHSWSATPSQTMGSIVSETISMSKGGATVSLGPVSKWVDNSWTGNWDGWVNGRISICDPYATGYSFVGLTTNSPENEGNSSQGHPFKNFGNNPGTEAKIKITRNKLLDGINYGEESLNFDQGRIMNIRNCIVQGTNLNVDFYPYGLSNSVITGYRSGHLDGTNDQPVTLKNFYALDKYSEFNSYNCSHLCVIGSVPGYSIAEITSFTKTSGQLYKGATFSISAYRNYPFCSGEI